MSQPVNTTRRLRFCLPAHCRSSAGFRLRRITPEIAEDE